MASNTLISIDLFYKESKALITYENMNVIRTCDNHGQQYSYLYRSLL
nr:MAG TPA: hypothetical protein [Caudoviricetes sp.]